MSFTEDTIVPFGVKRIH